MDPTTARQLLGVAKDDGPETIRQAFREKAKEEHPDQSGKADSTDRFRNLKRARDVLLSERNGAATGSGTGTRHTKAGATSSGSESGTHQTASGGVSGSRSRADETGQQYRSQQERAGQRSQSGTTGRNRTAGSEERNHHNADNADWNENRERATFSLEELRSLDPYEFEHFVADLWDAKGYTTTVSDASGDRGIDVIARDESADETVVIQAKRYDEGNHVGSPEVQQYGSLKMQDPYPDRVIIVTTSDFTDQASEIAADIGVELVNGTSLVTQANSHASSMVGPPDATEARRGHFFARGTITPFDKRLFALSLVGIVLPIIVLLPDVIGWPVAIESDGPTWYAGLISVSWLLPAVLVAHLLAKDGVVRASYLEGWKIPFYGLLVGVVVNAIASDAGWLNVIALAALLYAPLVGIVSVAHGYLRDGPHPASAA